MAPSDQLQWAVDGLDWPGREHSRFVRTPQVRWHVQVSGAGPVVLLLHGTGAASHSWRDVAPLLARHFTVVVPDLPGHGFTQTDSLGCLSLPGMTRACAQLLTTLGLEPAMVVGHSAAAAVAARACLDGYWQPRQLVSLCGALLPLQGLAGHLMPPAARLLAATGLASRLVCRPAGRPGAVERLIQSTGSQIDERGVALYRRLVSSPAHVQGVVRMMACWDLRAMGTELPRLKTPLLMVVAERDLTVAPGEARRVARLVPGARLLSLPGLGHLAHEENPALVCRLLQQAFEGVDEGR